MVLLYQLYAFLIVPCTCKFVSNGGSFWTEITYPLGQVISGDKLFCDISSEIVAFLVGRRGPHQDSSRAGCGPWAGRCAQLLYIDPDIGSSE